VKKLIAIIIAIATTTLFATNGMNMIGYGAKSSAMGGVSLGLWNDANSINTNPASISFIKNHKLDLSVGLLIPEVKFKNDLNDVKGETNIFPLPNLAYVNGNENKLTYGISFYSQGGMGATFKDLSHNIFRNYDMNPQTQDDPLVSYIEYHSKIGYMKLLPTISYKATPKLAFGVSPSVGYAMLEMKMPYSLKPSAMTGIANPETGMTFGDMFGAPAEQGGLGYQEVTAYADMGDGSDAYGFGANFGSSYKYNDNLSFGFTYALQSELTFKGNASMDMTAQFGQAYEKMVYSALMQMGITDISTATPEQIQAASQGVGQNLANMGIDMSKGMISDYNTEITMNWPQELGLGFAYKASEKFSFGLDVKWIDWKTAMKSFKMKFTNGTNENINAMMGGKDINLSMPLDWDAQIAIALGAQYNVNDKLTLRGGYNFANNPVPAETIIPIFPAVVENHITLGVGYKILAKTTFDLAYEYNMKKEVEVKTSVIADEYNGSTSSLAENVVHCGLTYNF